MIVVVMREKIMLRIDKKGGVNLLLVLVFEPSFLDYERSFVAKCFE